MSQPIIFLAYANDRVDPDRYLRNLVDETRRIREALEQRGDQTYRIELRPNATLEDIISVFDRNEGQVEVFHYAGHADSLQLMLEDSEGEIASAGLEGFTRLLAGQSGLELVFLNGCTTQEHAQAMRYAGIPHVIATDTLISDSAAVIFAERFYQRLADQKTISQAFEAAEIKVQTALLSNGSTRTLYWDGIESVPSTFPWAIYGNGNDWRLKLTPKSEGIGSIVHLMVDRDKQAEAFRDSLETVLEDQMHPPQFYIIQGARAEQHHSLVRRFRETDIRYYVEELYGPELGIVYFYEVKEWPYTGDLAMRRRNLKRSIARAAEYEGISGGKWKAADLMEAQKLRGGTVVFQHTISAEKWDTNALKLIEWYVRDFWEMSMVEGVPQFIIFLNIIYPQEAPNVVERLFGLANHRQRIQQQLTRLESEIGRIFHVLRELRAIPYEDVVNWVDEYFPGQLSGFPDILYAGNSRKRLPMQVAERRVREEVNRLERRQAREQLFDQLDE